MDIKNLIAILTFITTVIKLTLDYRLKIKELALEDKKFKLEVIKFKNELKQK